MKERLIIYFLLINIVSFAQTNEKWGTIKVNKIEKNSIIITKYNLGRVSPHTDFNCRAAEFPGGSIAMRNFILNNIQYPIIGKAIDEKCWVSFSIEINGQVTNAKIKKGISACPECDKEALRIVSTFPCFRSAVVYGVISKSKMTTYVEFKLN
ncbi:MAG: energy transducer TonB [Bacteroidota bacterium]